jgi:putative exosortase-associated protein (TIGR04073 family)
VTKGIPLIVGIIFIFTIPLTAFSDDAPEGPAIPKPFLKVGRGIVNCISSPLEIPNHMYLLSDHAHDNSKYGVRTAAAAIEGLFMGIGYTCWRFGAGIYDLITFPVPNYEKCIITPPFCTVSFEAYYEETSPESSAETPE